MAKSGSKYTHDTGPGYRGVYAARGNAVDISVAAMDDLGWSTDTPVDAIDDPEEPGIQLVNQPDQETIGACSMQYRGHGLLVHVYPDVLKTLDGFEPSEDIRVYDYEYGLTIVPRDPDPFVVGGDA